MLPPNIVSRTYIQLARQISGPIDVETNDVETNLSSVQEYPWWKRRKPRLQV